MFCRKCGKEIPDDSNVCQYCGVAVIRNQDENVSKEVVASEVAVAEKPRKSVWKIVIPIVAVIIVIAMICGIFMVKKISTQNKFRKLIEDAADKPIVEFIYDDFDEDGANEAFAVAGDEADGGMVSDGGIYFANADGAQVIRESITGYLCGIIESEDKIYVSVEIFNNEENHRSDVYTVLDSAPAKSDVSGKYENVMEVDGVITGIDPDTRVVVDIDIDIITSVKPIKPLNKNYLEATDVDFEKFDELIRITDINKTNFDVKHPRALSQAYDCLTGAYSRDVYGCFFGGDQVETHMGRGEFDMSYGGYAYDTPDPLGRFKTYSGYVKYPADKIDWIIENVFTLETDRKSSSVGYYYYDDYFYACLLYSEADLPRFTVEYERLSDGRYKFVANGEYSIEKEAEHRVEGVIGLVDVDSERIWEIYELKTYSTKTGKSLVPDTAVNYFSKTFGDIFAQFGNEFETYYFEGGDFAYYPEMYPLMGFCPEGLINDADSVSSKSVKYVVAWETAHVYKDFYVDMSYNELKELVPDIERPQFSEFDDTYNVFFSLDGYSFTYRWNQKPDDNMKCGEVWISKS